MSRVRFRHFPLGSQKSNKCGGALRWNDNQVKEYLSKVIQQVKSSHVIKDEIEFLMEKQQKCQVGPNSFLTVLLGLENSPGVFKIIFDKMVSIGIPPTTKHYNCVLSMNYHRGNLQETISTLHKMRHFGLIPNQYTYRTLILAFGKARKYNVSRVVFNSMEKDGVKPTLLNIKAVIRTSSNLATAMEIINKYDIPLPIPVNHVYKKDEEKIFECLFTACLNDRNVESAKWVSGKMELGNVQKGINISVREIELHHRVGDSENSFEMWEKLLNNARKKRETISVSSLNRFILICKDNIPSGCGDAPSVWHDRANDIFLFFRESGDRRACNWELLAKSLCQLCLKKRDKGSMRQLRQILRGERVLNITHDSFMISYVNQIEKTEIPTVRELSVTKSYSSDILIPGAPVTVTSRSQLPKW